MIELTYLDAAPMISVADDREWHGGSIRVRLGSMLLVACRSWRIGQFAIESTLQHFRRTEETHHDVNGHADQ